MNDDIKGLLDNFKANCELRGLAPSTVKFGVGEAGRFCEFINKHPAKADKKDVLAYLADLRQRQMKYRSMTRYFSGLSIFYDYLIEMEMVDRNPIGPVRKKYLRCYKEPSTERRAISVKEASGLVNSIIDTRDRALVTFLLKTGIRRKELVELDISGLNMDDMSLELKPTPKRSNRIVFFDQESRELLLRWLHTREVWVNNRCLALFVNRKGERLSGRYIEDIILNYAMKVGLHDPKSKDPKKRFTPHCCRHFFTTELSRAGMPREFIQELRGDVRREAIDIYDHIDKKELQESYLAHIPQLGV
jgi:integrase/recombinase XerD